MRPLEKQDGFPGQRLVVVPRPMVATSLEHPLLKHLLPTDAGFYPRAHGHKCTRPKGCPETVFIHCAAGSGRCEVAGQTHEVGKDQLLVIPAGIPHAYGAATKDPWTIHWFHAVGTNVPFYLQRLGVTVETPLVPLEGDVRLFALFEDVLEDLERACTLTHLIYAAHSLSHLMGVILRHREEFAHKAIDSRERAATSIEFMKEHLREPLQIASLAAVVNLSRSHYTTLFQRVTGYAPLRYLNHLRMQRAVQLLNTTHLSIKEIGEQVGFPDQFYFSRAFSRMHGHAPSQHRQRYGG
ncbi:MAG TPA: AraC family transcriptional regulator [Candidatus Acidoferrum sp.]|nr:AraC family transcriptional regulator [Candidatus Acidoferrum sp.]